MESYSNAEFSREIDSLNTAEEKALIERIRKITNPSDAARARLEIQQAFSGKTIPLQMQRANSLALGLLTAVISNIDLTDEETPAAKLANAQAAYVAKLHSDLALAKGAENGNEVVRLEGILAAHKAKDDRAALVSGWCQDTNAKIAAEKASGSTRAAAEYTKFREEKIAGISAAYRGQRTVEDISSEFDASAESANAKSALQRIYG